MIEWRKKKRHKIDGRRSTRESSVSSFLLQKIRRFWNGGMRSRRRQTHSVVWFASRCRQRKPYAGCEKIKKKIEFFFENPIDIGNTLWYNNTIKGKQNL